MATKNVERVDVFPEGTVVKAYPATQYHPGQTGAPAGASAATATVTTGVAAFTGLTASTAYVAYASVSGEDRYLDFTVDPAAAITPPTGLPEPQQNKLLGWSFDPSSASGTKILTTGTLHIARVPIKEPVKIANILLGMTTKAATLTAGQSFAGIFSEGRALLATTADLAATFEGATGILTLALTSAVNVPAGFVLVGFYSTGTTPPTLSVGTATTGVVNAGASGTGSRYATGDTGLTTALPNPITASMAASSIPWWVGLS